MKSAILFSGLVKACLVTSFLVAVFLTSGCGSDSGGNGSPTGTLTATVGPTAFVATTITVTGSTKRTIRTTNEDGFSLSLTFIETTVGQYSLINQAFDTGPGVAGGYSASGETYSIDSGNISITAYSNNRAAGTFNGTARGLLGATDLPVLNGTFDISY